MLVYRLSARGRHRLTKTPLHASQHATTAGLGRPDVTQIHCACGTSRCRTASPIAGRSVQTRAATQTACADGEREPVHAQSCAPLSRTRRSVVRFRSAIGLRSLKTASTCAQNGLPRRPPAAIRIACGRLLAKFVFPLASALPQPRRAALSVNACMTTTQRKFATWILNLAPSVVQRRTTTISKPA